MTTKILDGLNKFGIDTGLGMSETLMCSISDNKLFNKAIESIEKNNTYVPSITRIIYNIKQENDKAVLATVVYFADNTKVTVVNSDNDKVDLITDKDTGVTTADEASKERALVYAICKKVFGKPDAKGNVIGDGFGRKLRALVTGGWDQKVEEKKAALEKAKAKAKHEEMEKAAAAKPKRLSLAEAMDKLSVAVKEVESIKADIENLKKNPVA